VAIDSISLKILESIFSIESGARPLASIQKGVN